MSHGHPDRLRQEHDTLRRLAGVGGSPRVMDQGTLGDAFWFGMEYIEGEPILEHVRALGRRGGTARIDWVQHAAQDILSALGDIHQHGVLHCDLKASNVLVEPSGRVRLIDFGSARYLAQDSGACCGARFAGTLGYAPPEQLVGAFLDARTDLFAAGVLFYRLLTDRLPFWGRSLPEALREIQAGPRTPPTGPPGLVRLIMESLSSRPERRPLSTQAALQHLQGARA